jgi:formamidopyrimidine-DNA glycosylase
MPELPEVETVRRQLAPLVSGRRLVRTEAWLPRITLPSPQELIRRTEGRVVLGAERRGKQLYFPLEDGAALLIHLGMSGRLFELMDDGAAERTLPAHTHASFSFQDGPRIVYVDPRTFGKLQVMPDLAFLESMGPDPLSDAFDPVSLAARMRTRRVRVKAALLDQHMVAGLGNIYADEVCFLAGVHPAARGCNVPTERLIELARHIRPTLHRAVEAGGVTLRDGMYRDLFGRAGTFFPAVYGQAGTPCPRCGTEIQAGKLGQGLHPRSYHYCPVCQVLPAE